MNSPEQPDALQPERRIALIGPERVSEQRAAQAMKLLGSMFWAFKETERCNWTVYPPESADVVVVSHTVDPERFAAWKRSGKLMVVVAPDIDADIDPGMLAAPVLVYPFRAAEVLNLLGRLEQQLISSCEPHEILALESGNGGAANESATPWAFVETLRTLREVQNAEAWIEGRDGNTALLWLKGDGSYYAAEPSIVHAIRRGAIDLSWLHLRGGSPPPDGPAVRAGIELAWFAGYHASEKPAPWLNPDKRFRLARLPEFDLIRPSHSQLRIVDILAETASDLTELAACSHVSLEEATRTLNALAACDVLALPASPGPSSALKLVTTQVVAALTRGLSALLRTSADFLDARTSTFIGRKRAP